MFFFFCLLFILLFLFVVFFFFFNDTATTEIYTFPYTTLFRSGRAGAPPRRSAAGQAVRLPPPDRKSTRLNSSHRCISYAVFCLKKKKNKIKKPWIKNKKKKQIDDEPAAEN